ncbi:MAG: dTDP-4-dehydrorhamnose 3,5-epimerase family protein [Alphaproteobacteria bacterium]
MKFRPTNIAGVVEILPELREDARGGFSRAFCAEEFAAAGLPFAVVQANVSSNRVRGTLRGLHWQAAPAEEAKIVRAVAGRVWDVAVDLRPDSPTRGRWTAVELDARRGNACHIPVGCAHGFLTLEDGSDLLYLMGTAYRAELQRGARWDDPAFAIEWPFAPVVIAERDRSFADWRWGAGG